MKLFYLPGDVFQIDGIKNGIAKATLVAKFSALVQVLLAKTC